MKHQRWQSNLVLLAALLVYALPLTCWAQFIFSTNNGTFTITGYTGPGGNVTIPSIINGYPVTTIGTKAFYYETTVTGVTIPDNATTIGDL